MKQQVLDRLNAIIDEEMGKPVSMDSLFRDSELDSLSTICAIISLDAEYSFLGADEDLDEYASYANMPVAELVARCVMAQKETVDAGS